MLSVRNPAMKKASLIFKSICVGAYSLALEHGRLANFDCGIIAVFLSRFDVVYETCDAACQTILRFKRAHSLFVEYFNFDKLDHDFSLF